MIKRSAKLDRRRQIEQLLTQAEEAVSKNDTKTLYKVTKTFSGKENKSIMKHIRDIN